MQVRVKRELDRSTSLPDYSFHFVLNLLRRHIVQERAEPGTSFTHAGGSVLFGNDHCSKELTDHFFLFWGPLHLAASLSLPVVLLFLPVLLWLALLSNVLHGPECINGVFSRLFHLVPPLSSLAAVHHLLGHEFHPLRV